MSGPAIMTALALLCAIEPHQALNNFEQVCQDETLWGRTMCGPMMVIDTEGSQVWANEPGDSSSLIWDGSAYFGPLQHGVATANTSFHWAGLRWAGVVLPLPADAQGANRLLLHEAWHREQDLLGFPATLADNKHLDELDGRVWLRLEMRALAAALEAAENERLKHLLAAVMFRSRRYEWLPSARAHETALEWNEGLAEYTGIRLGESQPIVAAVNQLRRFDQYGSLVRSFAYATGPGWGLLLDSCRPGWRQDLHGGSNFLDLAQSCLQSSTAPDALESLMRAHGHDQVVAEERELEQTRLRARTTALQRLQAPGSIVLPLEGASYEFDPNSVRSAGSSGSLFGGLKVRASWGDLEARGEVLMSPDFSTLRISPVQTLDGDAARGDGWVLQLKAPCRLGGPAGNLTVECSEIAVEVLENQ